MTTPTLITVVGPTAIGKTRLAIALAQHFKTEIISADSRQFYKEMTIGTAVPSPQELQAVPHHFIQHKSIFEPYSVGDFEREALQRLGEIFASNDVAIMVGGSGLYIDAVTKGLDSFPKIDPGLRRQLNGMLKIDGISALQKQLQSLDKTYYGQVDLHNPHRLIRALEICIGTGKPYSSFLNRKKSKRHFKTITLALYADRKIVYERIDLRVDKMVKNGLLDEAENLYGHRDLNALQTVGYKELFEFIAGVWEFDFAVAEIKKNTRRFAKRQMTWFKKNQESLWVDHTTPLTTVIEKVTDELKKNHIDGKS